MGVLLVFYHGTAHLNDLAIFYDVPGYAALLIFTAIVVSTQATSVRAATRSLLARTGLPDCEALLLMETDGHPSVVAEEAANIHFPIRNFDCFIPGEFQWGYLWGAMLKYIPGESTTRDAWEARCNAEGIFEEAKITEKLYSLF